MDWIIGVGIYTICAITALWVYVLAYGKPSESVGLPFWGRVQFRLNELGSDHRFGLITALLILGFALRDLHREAYGMVALNLIIGGGCFFTAMKGLSPKSKVIMGDARVWTRVLAKICLVLILICLFGSLGGCSSIPTAPLSSDFWNFVAENKVYTFFLGLYVMVMTILVINAITVLIQLPFRAANIRKHGWPPAHCDADGDSRLPPDEDEKANGKKIEVKL